MFGHVFLDILWITLNGFKGLAIIYIILIVSKVHEKTKNNNKMFTKYCLCSQSHI